MSGITNPETPRGALGKRKDRNSYDRTHTQMVASKPEPLKFYPARLDNKPAAQKGNKLLASYLAHEFLTCGTLLGKPVKKDTAPAPAQAKNEPASKTYEEVTHLLMAGGVHISGVVNPTQLGRWIQMKP